MDATMDPIAHPENTEQQRVAVIAQAIADELNKEDRHGDPSWTAQMPTNGSTHYREVRHPLGLALAAGTWSGRLDVHGVYPRPKVGNAYAHIPRPDKARASFTPDRDPAAIAREAVRRVMPLYREQYAAALASVQQSDDHDAASHAVAVDLRVILGDTSSHATDDHGFRFYAEGAYGDGRAYPDSVSYDRLSIPLDMARDVARVIRAWNMARARFPGDADAQRRYVDAALAER